ncbi:hypothetical protein BGZ46_000160 [Entomortierella lignicola]|nr:hypothetical protein BGZ46_000160 [Entomortierella lignicola]
MKKGQVYTEGTLEEVMKHEDASDVKTSSTEMLPPLEHVAEREKLDSKVVCMLKSALSLHVLDYTLELKYSDDNAVIDVGDDNYEIVKVMDSL